MKGNIKTLFKRFCFESSIAGLKYLYLFPDPLSRCFWTVNILAVSTLACHLSWLLYVRFTDMPTRIAIENQYEPVTTLSYPAITICSPNQITIGALNHFKKTLVDGNVTMNLEKALPKLLGFYELLAETNLNELTQLQHLLDVNRYKVPEVLQGLPQRCDVFLKLCIFEYKRYLNCATLFRPILTAHGLCCIFNGQYYLKDKKRNEIDPKIKRRMVRNSGMLQGLTVITDYDPENALPGTVLNAGALRIMYTDTREFPADDEINLVEPNKETYHTIHATYTYCSEDVKVLPAWSRQCYFEDEEPLIYFKSYHNSDCDHICFSRAIEKSCQCVMPYLPHLHPSLVCNVTSIPCIMSVKLKLGKWLRPEYCDCPRDCESLRYRVEMSSGNLKGLEYIVHNPYSEITINSSTSIMHFFFTNAGYVKQKQETVMSLISLASNLGGVFGLCLGLSAMSILEMLFFVYVAIRNSIRDRWLQ